MSEDFKGRHFSSLIILQCLRWYLRYPLSYRQIEEIMEERGVELDHTTIYRWIQKYSPEFEKRIRWHARRWIRSWFVDETYIKVKGKWKYLYRAVDDSGNTIDFMLSHTRDIDAAKRFFKKALQNTTEKPVVINTDKLSSYKTAIRELQQEKVLPKTTKHTTTQYKNNIIESDHRRIKRRTRPMLGFKKFHTAQRVLKGIETMNMMVKQQSIYFTNSIKEQISFIHKIFNVYSYDNAAIAD